MRASSFLISRFALGCLLACVGLLQHCSNGAPGSCSDATDCRTNNVCIQGLCREQWGHVAWGVVARGFASVPARITVRSPSSTEPTLLLKTGRQWRGVFSPLSVANDHTFLVRAWDNEQNLLGQATLSKIAVQQAQTTTVFVWLSPKENPASMLQSVILSQQRMKPLDVLQLQARVHPDVRVTYQWQSKGGAWSLPTAAQTQWSAPSQKGLQALQLTVALQGQRTETFAFAVQVESQPSSEGFPPLVFNVSPQLSQLVAKPIATHGETLSLHVEAFDWDHDTFSYQWRSSCAGVFGSPEQPNTTFQVPRFGDSCQLSVKVEDPGGGTLDVSHLLNIRPTPPTNLLPVWLQTTSSKSSITRGERVLLQVKAMDPEGGALTFTWKASTGTLSSSIDSAQGSQTEWTAPKDGCEGIVSVTVKDPEGAERTYRFRLKCKYHWIMRLGQPSIAFRSLLEDPSGSFYIHGLFGYPQTLGSFSLNTAGKPTLFVCKLSPQRTVAWAKTPSGTLVASGRMTFDSANNKLWLGSVFQGGGSWGASPFSVQSSQNIGVVASLSSKDGEWGSIHSLVSQVNDHVLASLVVAPGTQGTFYIAGSYYRKDDLRLGTTLLHKADPKATRNDGQMFIAHLKADGSVLWFKLLLGTSTTNKITHIHRTPSGRVVLMGSFSQTLPLENYTLKGGLQSSGFVAALDARGEWLWAHVVGQDNFVEVSRVIFDAQEHLYIAGSFINTVNFRGTTLTSQGATDVFVTRWDKDGNQIWVTSGGGKGVDTLNDMTMGPLGNLFIGGSLTMDATFGSHATNPVRGNQDALLVKLSEEGTWLGVQTWGGEGQDAVGALHYTQHQQLLVLGTYGHLDKSSKPKSEFGPLSLSEGGGFLLSLSY
ncbi:MAG: hypothetical protein EP343_32005 [Deltaproteobacteria bacterium]|nr:MAG: hypothetical protein EP343_32005 [Deltaproteobacteria bacterium]